MKRYLFTVSFIFQLLLPGQIFALEKLSEVQLKGVHAQSGISMTVSNAAVYLEAAALEFTAVDNLDPFGLATSGTGFLSLNDLLGLAVFDAEAHIDVGIYTAPDEHLVVTDIGKTGGGDADSYLEHQYVQDRQWGIISDLGPDIYYYPIGDDIERPLDGQYATIQVSVQDFTSIMDVRSSIGFCGKDLGTFGMSGFSMPDFVHENVHLPGSVVTLFPGPGCSINIEMRLRLTLDEFKLSGQGSSSSPDIVVSGVHIGEAFGAELPDHLVDTGVQGETISTSAWGSDIVNVMHSGYFLVGNLNQIEFTDDINDEQLFYLGLSNPTTHDYTDDNNDPVGLIANPLSINMTADENRAYISMSTGIHGSLRIESVKGWNDSDMGPAAVDGIRVKHCVIEFPGEYKRPDGSFKGRIHPGQQDWLNDLINQP